MDEEIDRLVISVRADTRGLQQDVDAARQKFEPLETGAERAGRAIEGALVRAVRTGKFGFDELRALALQVLNEIAVAAVRAGVGAIVRGAGGGGDAGLAGVLAGLLGSPGRATGGPVSPGRPYWVGERGPELFVPTAASQVQANGGGGAREVRVAITVNASGGEAPRALAQSSRQVARAVKAALAGVE